MADQQENLSEQPLLQHLIELRQRILKVFVAILVVFLCLFYFSNDIYDFVSQPLQKLLPEGSTMIATDVASPFFAPFKLTLVVAMLVAMPIILQQLWGFIAPGLYQREKHIVLPLLLSSIILFYLGVAFAYLVVFPLIFKFFTAVGPDSVTMMTDINSYLNFVLKLFFAFGFAFQIPIAVVVLCWTGITDTQSFANKRPYIVVGCFVIGMLLTPPDIISQTLLAGPMWLLFEVGIVLAKMLPKASDSSTVD